MKRFMKLPLHTLVAWLLVNGLSVSQVDAVTNAALAEDGVEPFKTCQDHGPTHQETPCYLTPTDGKYGFHYGAGHGGSSDLALDRGAHYSMDRCALAHDNGFWGDDCNNNYWVQFCVMKVTPDTEDEGTFKNEVTGGWGLFGPLLDPGAFKLVRPNDCSPEAPWVELPHDPKQIRIIAGKGTLPNPGVFRTRDNDTIRFSIQDGKAETIEICLQSIKSVTWWKGIKIFKDASWTEVGIIETVDAKHGPSCMRIALSEFQDNASRLELWKAKALGVHTDIGHYTFKPRQLSGKRLLFVWEKD